MMVHEDAYGASGELSRGERIDRLAGKLVDHVCETLTAYGAGCGLDAQYCQVQIPNEAVGLITRLVAAAMISQFDYDEERSGEMIALVANGCPLPLPDNPVIEPH
jgi:hypothetical protein